jgi:DnaK suppressor protein
MRKKQLNELRETLLSRKEIIIANIDNGVNSITNMQSLECNDELDYAEISSDSFKEEKIIAQQEAELKEINEALDKIESGEYGVCEMCDEEIAVERLKAKPFAKFCIPCREIYEQEQNKG